METSSFSAEYDELFAFMVVSESRAPLNSLRQHHVTIKIAISWGVIIFRQSHMPYAPNHVMIKKHQ